jgi:predicted phage terminase large subunit-like protein
MVEPIRVVLSTPPQHGKTETIKHALALKLARDPRRRNAYVTYESDRAEAISQETQWIADDIGVQWEGNRKRWVTREGGGLLATGVGGPLTGYGVDGMMVIDDPFKNREEADSGLMREKVSSWFTSTAMTRCHPTASVVLVQTRWHPDDLAGRQAAKGWEVINLPAIDSDGKALWEAKRPLEWLKAQREEIGEYDWWALYQGQPRSRGDAVFKEPRFYNRQIPDGFKLSIGVDFAYSSKTYADYSVAVVMAFDGRYHYVLDVVRRQVKADAFGGELKSLQQKYNATAHAYIGGTEKGIVDFMKREGVRINDMPASQDKFTRAQAVAAAWNRGDVLIPQNAPWVAPFLSELASFTGVKDRHDDQVDALAGAFSPYAKAPAIRIVSGTG